MSSAPKERTLEHDLPASPRMSAGHEQVTLADGLWESAASTVTTVEPGSMSECLYWEHAHRHRLSFRLADSWATDLDAICLDGAAELIHTEVPALRTALFVLDDVLIHVRVARGRAAVSLAAGSEAGAKAALERVRRALPVPEPPPGVPQARFSFSWKTERGTSWTSRTLDVSPWDEIAENYAISTGREVARLMGDFRPSDSGQTIIWHGEPGTGKTHALRALAYEWREWCDLHVVTDPDQLFGSDAGYLMDVIASPPDRRADARHRLIVLEDSGELLTGDARRLVGHGLSRFLNVCDGLLGQAEKLSVLVTTNEPMKRIHPAVRRPGRCAAEVEFRRLDPDEANLWLDGRTHHRVSMPMGIAQLYALASGDPAMCTARTATRPIGFGAELVR